MPTTFRVRVYRRELSALFQPTGQGGRWLDRLRLRMHRAAVADAPSRTNNLAGAHRSYIRGVNQFACEAKIVNDAPHAGYVHGGTDGSTGTPTLFLPAGGPGRNTVSPYAGQRFGNRRVKSVAGQQANPWLDRACTRIAKSQGAVEYG